MQSVSSQSAHLRHVGDVKPLSASRSEISVFFNSPTFFYFSFFKQLANQFTEFFKKQPKIRSIFITNDKKARLGSNIYFVRITAKELVYEEETDNKLVRFVYLFEQDDILINQSVVYNPQTKQKLMKKLQAVGDDIQLNQVFIFES